MIVPMKKVSLITLGDKKTETLKKLRKLGLLHIEITEGSGEKLNELKNQISLLESGIYETNELAKKKAPKSRETDLEALAVARDIASLTEEKKACQSEQISLKTQIQKHEDWGDFDPRDFKVLAEKGVDIRLYEIPKSEYETLGESVKTICLSKTKTSVNCLVIKSGDEDEENVINSLKPYRLELPAISTLEIKQKIADLGERIEEIDGKISSYVCFTDKMKQKIETLEKEIQFEVYSTGMESENLSENSRNNVSVSYFTGYIEAENLEKLKRVAGENSWGLLVEDPTVEDNVPTKLKNNKFVSLIYPLTDFLGTVPGYFEYDISGWFLAFILIFFGIIFGDGGYGLIVLAAAALLIGKSLVSKKEIPSAFLLVGLFGLSTVLWGTLTCTWFGISAESLPRWLQSLSVPVISNVYADKIWYPFWCDGDAGLTTAQNLQIFCFTLALIQLVVAHIMGALRNRKSVKILGDIGSILQLLGMYYIVLSLVVNSKVFSFGLKISGIPVGTVAIICIALGFILSFVFSNYEGSVVKSIITSLTNIVSVLLGVVNVFSDIVSYIRLWAVGLAGSAISATVNELAGPLLGHFMFMILAIALLVFGHGLNMILNVLSVIVHGIRLNTLEFSSHLDMSWSGHKFEPFEE